MNAVKKFNGLNGNIVTREELENLVDLAIKQEQTEVVQRLLHALAMHEDDNFEIDLQRQAIECVPKSLLPLLEEAPELPEEEHGLGKAVSPDDIYTMITNKMIEFIKEANKSDYKKKWEGKVYGKGYLIPFNFESKKRYRGINAYMLRDFDKPLENPFYLTFKQVEKLGGKVKKGSTGHEVVYFTQLYTYSQKEPALDFGTYDKKEFKSWFEKHKHLIPVGEHQKEHSIPILKYYNVFNGKDIEDIDFDLENFKVGYINKELPADEPMPIADAIVENFPAPKVPINHGGDKAAYYPGADHIKMPHKADFETAQDYYRTLFHELGHATGNQKRLSRDLTGKFGSKKYAFEELAAELNAVFVSAEAGFMWHTNKNHAGYLKGWNSVLTHIQDDNRFVMRAATQGQKAADFILQPDADGNPAYMKKLKVDTKKPKVEPETEKPVTKTFDIGKKKGKTVPKKTKTGTDKEFIVTIPIERILMDYNKEKASAATIAEIAKNYEPKKFSPLNVWQDKKSSKVYLLEGLNRLEALKKLNKENAPVVFSKTAPKKPKTRAELEAANPKGYARKPKSVAVTTAIKDVLSLPKYKGKINERQAAILYKHFKDDAFGSEIFSDVTSDYERGIMKKENEMYDFDISNDQLEIEDFGMEFIQAVNARRESLLNQKNNLALFEGLNGKSPAKKPTKRKPKKTTPKKKARKGLKSPAPAPDTEPQPEPQINITPEPAATAQTTFDGGDQSDAPAVPVKNKKPSLMDMEFDSIEMDEGWENFMQHPAANMKIAIYGKPKNGKTSGALKFVHYLTKHGNVLYNFADQGFNKSTKDLWISSGLANKPNATPSDIDNLNDLEAEIGTGKYKIVVIDMINDYINREGIKPQEFKDRFIKKYPNVSFILVFEVTKDGNFKGDQGWTHIVDAIFTVENFLMENRGRYGIGHFIVWEEGLKKFDPKKYEEIKQEQEETPQPETETPQSVEVEEIPGFSITEV